MAVNGPAALQQYVEAGYPRSEMVEVEALRYLHVTGVVPPRHARSGAPVVLICGDNIPGANDRLMSVLAEADALLPDKATYIFKPHKAAPFDITRFNLDASTSTAELAQLLTECDVVVTSSTTSAAVDAYCSGRPVVTMFDAVALNLSPLRGFEGLTVCHDAGELAAAILAGQRAATAPAPRTAFFHLDGNLPRWRRLLGVAEAAASANVQAFSQSR